MALYFKKELRFNLICACVFCGSLVCCEPTTTVFYSFFFFFELCECVCLEVPMPTEVRDIWSLGVE